MIHKFDAQAMLLTESDEAKHFERVYQDAHAEDKAKDVLNLMLYLNLSFGQAVSILRLR